MSSRSSRRSRSRSRDSTRSGSRKRDSERPWLRSSRSNTRSRSRSRSRSRGSKSRSKSPHYRRTSRRRSRSPSPVRPVMSKEPKYMNARVFVANLASDKVSNGELQEQFEKHGRVIDVLVHHNGYGFVQFANEEDGRNAVAAENNVVLGGKRIKCNMAAEGKRNPYVPTRGGAAAEDRLPRERSPLRDPYGPPPYADPYLRGRDLPPPPPRDPYFDDPYRRPLPPDPYYDRFRDDPFRRDPYALDPYRDPYRDPFRDPLAFESLAPRKPVDCEIIIMNAQLRDYADLLDRRLRNLNLITSVIVIREDRTIQQQVEDATRRNCLFAIVINSQNELHRSLTLNILHGVPQEHRNMPLDDALSLVARSFEKYLQAEKEKTLATPTPGSSAARVPPTPFLPPPKEISYLLNLLADNRQLTVDELDKVILYLKERKDKLLEAEGVPVPPASNGGAERPPAERPPPAPVDPEVLQQQHLQQIRDKQKHQQQQELQNKILSMMNGSSASAVPGSMTEPQSTVVGMTIGGLSVAGLPAAGLPAAVPAAAALATQPGLATSGIPMPKASLQQSPLQSQNPLLLATATPVVSTSTSSGPGQAATLINFDNPTVQKALDNLIQSGPNLLKNISTSGILQATAPSAPAGASSQGHVGYPTGTHRHY